MAANARTIDPKLESRLADGSLAGQWMLDPSRSSVSLQSKAMWGMASVRGGFSDVSGRAVILPSGEASGTISVGSESVSTKNAQRDKHLRSADFFESDVHPHIVFTAQQVTLGGDGATVTGTLQVRDRTRPLTVPVAVSALDDDAIQLDAEVQIDRSDFGLTWNMLGATSMKNTLTVRAVFIRN
jgi:polyisoprenoid-binding protein YceI